MRKLQLSLVLPIHNQGTIIKPVVTEIVQVLETAGISFEIIMVENGSTDKTLSVLKNLARKDKRLKVAVGKKGYGSAVLKGLNEAKGTWVGYMPSDGQIDPAVLPKLLKKIQKDHFDLVKVKRVTRENFIRFVRSKIFNLLANAVFGKLPVTDINGSPRVFNRRHLKKLQLSYNDSFIDLEFALKARYLGWKIKEIPIKTLPRAGGKSTVNIKTVFEFLYNMFTYRIGNQFEAWRVLLE